MVPGRVASRHLVHQDDGGRGQFQRAFDHLARINWRMVDGADLLQLVGNELIRSSRNSTRNCSRSAKAWALRQ